MKNGKHTCKILKEIRTQIAAANDIEFVTEECRYKGDCLGTCPKCEAEVRYLEQQLSRRQAAGRAVSLVGLSLSVAAISTQIPGCGTSRPTTQNSTSVDTIEKLLGIIPETATQKDTIPAKPKKRKKIDPIIEDGGLMDLQGELLARKLVEDNPELEIRLTTLFENHFVLPQDVDSTDLIRIDVRFTRQPGGSITNIRVFPDYYGSAFDNEVVRVLRLMPKEAIATVTDYNIPIIFTPKTQAADTTSRILNSEC